MALDVSSAGYEVNAILTPAKPFARTAVATAAEVTFQNPTNVVELLAPADNVDGGRVTRIYAIPRAAIAAALNCQLYKKVGTTYTLIDSALMGLHTPSATVANAKTEFSTISEEVPLILEPGEGLAVAIGTAIANGVVFRASGGLYDKPA